nr:E3 ubiquitin-protein ligase UPL7 [Tanacetum cinerariifolium]
MYSLWGDPWFILISVSLNLNLDQRVILIAGVYLKHLYGGNHDIDVDDLRSNTKYSGGLIEGSLTVKLFWEEDNQDKVSYVHAQAGDSNSFTMLSLMKIYVKFSRSEVVEAKGNLYQYDEKKLWILGSGPQCFVPKELALHKHTSSNLEKIRCYHDRHDILEALYASNLTYAPVAAQVPYRWHDSVNALDNT